MSKSGYRGLVNALYVMNVVSQAIFSLAAPIAVGILISYLTVRFLSAPTWIYAPITVLCAISGICSMIKFILSAMAGLERLEKEQKSKDKEDERTENNI